MYLVVLVLSSALVGGRADESLEYRVWRVFSEDARGFTAVVVSVDQKHFNREDMTALAARLREEFADKAKLKVGLLDDPDTARLFAEGKVNYGTYEKAERGRYYLDRTACREYIQFSSRRGKPKTTLRLKCHQLDTRAPIKLSMVNAPRGTRKGSG